MNLNLFKTPILLILLSFIAHAAVAQYAFSLYGGGYNIGVDVQTDTDGNTFVIGNFQGTVDFDPSSSVYELTSQKDDERDIYVASYNSSGGFRFAFSLGPETFSINLAKGIVVDVDGNFHITGVFYGNTDFDPSAAVYNLTAENAIYGNFFLASYNNSGSFRYAFNLNIGYPFFEREFLFLQTDDIGNIYMVGTYDIDVDFDPGPDTVNLSPGSPGLSNFLASYDIDGNFRFVIPLSIGPGGHSFSLATGKDGISYITGAILWPHDFDPGEEERILTADENGDWFLASYYPDGSLNFAHLIDADVTVGSDIGLKIAVDDNDNISLSGRFGGVADFDLGEETYELVSLNSDLFLASYNSDLDLRFVFNIGTEITFQEPQNRVTPSDLVTDNIGNIYLTGFIHGTVDFDPGDAEYILSDPIFTNGSDQTDIFFASYNSQGEFRFANRLGKIDQSDNGSYPKIAVDANHNSCITGAVRGNLSFDSSNNQYSVESTSSRSYSFLTCYDPDGTVTTTDSPDLTSIDFEVYPNPAMETINFSLSNNFEAATISIATVTGKVCYSGDVNGTLSLDVSNYAKGYYVVTMIDKDNRVINKPLIIQ